jgi:hypothetical protein
MKTPRDLLLAQHRAAEPQLDALRREVVQQFREEQHVTVRRMNFLSLLWRELILPSRRLWAAVATAWVVILLVNLSLRDPVPGGSVKVYAPAMMSFQEQQTLLNALLTDRSSPVDIDRPKSFTPRPSGERFVVKTA